MLEKLKDLKGCQVVDVSVPGFNGLRLDVTTLKVWQDNLSQLNPLFGKLVFEEFEKLPFDSNNSSIISKTLDQLKISFNDISYMYVLETSNEFVGLIAMKVYKEIPRIEVVIELIIDPKYRGQGFAPKIYDLVFKERGFEAVISYSKNPAAVTSRYQVGRKCGYETYFGSMSTGFPKIIDLQNEAKEYFQKEGIVADFTAPQGYIFLKGEDNVNAPLQEGEAKFDPTDPLYQPFRDILELQKTNNKDTAVGLLVSVRK